MCFNSEIIKYPKISVVTPNYNQVQFIETTILSVLDQNYPNLEYIIIDGGSTDGSVEIIRKYESKLFYWESVEDNGLYHALNKGFTISTGDIMCWINSDDILWKDSLMMVQNIFKNNHQLHWLQGLPTVIDVNGKVVFQRNPVCSKFYFYLRNHLNSFSFIQQESTFWSRELWVKAEGFLNQDYKLAADFDLWMRFFNMEKLYCTNITLGAFRTRKDQLSANKELYLKEANQSLQVHYKNLAFWDTIRISFLLNLRKLKKRKGFSFIDSSIKKMQGRLIGNPNIINTENS